MSDFKKTHFLKFHLKIIKGHRKKAQKKGEWKWPKKLRVTGKYPKIKGSGPKVFLNIQPENLTLADFGPCPPAVGSLGFPDFPGFSQEGR